METIQLHVGSYSCTSNTEQDNRRPVEFVGEKLATRTEYGTSDRTGGLTDTRGTSWTLYRTQDGRLVVHIEDWSHWQGEPNTYTLVEVTEADLQPNGHFEDLGREAGFGRPLTLDEALTPRDQVLEESGTTE